MIWMMVVGPAGVAGALMYLRMKAYQRLPADARLLLTVINALAQKEDRSAEGENIHSPDGNHFPVPPG